MARHFLALSEAQRDLAFEQTAAIRGLDPVIVEKDFWVCWLLGVLWGLPSIAPHVVFKGGTSLSKVYGVIDRFSEDIDLSLAPEFVGANVEQLEQGNSMTQRARAMHTLQQRCRDTVKDIVQPRLERAIAAELGVPAEGTNWLTYESDADERTPVLYFGYPTRLRIDSAYIVRAVKLELGSLTDQQPTGRHTITPFVAVQYPNVFVDWECEIVTLDLGRTFWEKATILHAEYHRAADKPTPSRFSRHYADVARLLLHPDADLFLADDALCARVVDWKHRLFRREWARYDLARPGSFRFTPNERRVRVLERDYHAMRPMFMHEPPPFTQVLEQLKEAEEKINRR